MNQKKARWRRLDNAAKLYSAASNKRDTRVLVLCELKVEGTFCRRHLDRDCGDISHVSYGTEKRIILALSGAM